MPTLKIGFVGVTSGPAAAWGTSNVRSMQTLAAWLNEKGGVQDRRQDLRHRDRHLRRPEGSQARHRRHGEDGAGRHPLRRRPERRRRRRRGPPGRRAERHHLLPLRLPEVALRRAGLERRARHDRELPVGSGDLQIPEGKQGREEDRLRRRQRVRSAQPARRRRRGGQGARPRRRLRRRHLPGRHHRLHAGAAAGDQDRSRTCSCSRASRRPTRRC